MLKGLLNRLGLRRKQMAVIVFLVMVMAKAGGAFQAIAEAVEAMVGQIEQVSAATRKQVENSGRLFKAVESIASVTQESAAGVNEISSGAEQQTASVAAITESARSLAMLAGDLRTAVMHFRLDQVVRSSEDGRGVLPPGFGGNRRSLASPRSPLLSTTGDRPGSLGS